MLDRYFVLRAYINAWIGCEGDAASTGSFGMITKMKIMHSRLQRVDIVLLGSTRAILIMSDQCYTISDSIQ